MQINEAEEEDNDKSENRKFITGPNIVKSIGVFFAIGALILVLVMFLGCLYSCAYTKYSIFSCFMKLKNNIFYNALIRFSL